MRRRCNPKLLCASINSQTHSEIARKKKALREAEEEAEFAKQLARSEKESVLDVQALHNDLRRLENAARLAGISS